MELSRRSATIKDCVDGDLLREGASHEKSKVQIQADGN
jgi:hypothetical protein